MMTRPYAFLCAAGLLVAVFCAVPNAQSAYPDVVPCESDGDVSFVCGLTNPEDLYQVPQTPWVVASGRVSDVEGPIYVVDTRDSSARVTSGRNGFRQIHLALLYC